MRPWHDSQKQLLRHLAAARFFLPIELDQGDFPNTEAQYQMFLHQSEFELALEYIESLGERHTGYAEESMFWDELLQASEIMGLSDHSAMCKSRLDAIVDGI